MVQDLTTQWIQSYPCETKTSQETRRSLRKFLEPPEKPKVIFSDNYRALAKLVKTHHGIIVHPRFTVPRQNGIAERVVRRIEERTSAILLHSG